MELGLISGLALSQVVMICVCVCGYMCTTDIQYRLNGQFEIDETERGVS